MKEITIENAENIRPSAAGFIAGMKGKKIFAFEGDMGVGKTTFIRAVCEALGVEDTVNSPTFSIVNEYRSQTTGELIYHFDFYRINRTSEALDMGVDDYFDSGALCFIEWPGKITALLPENTVHIKMEEQPGGSRKLTVLSP
ncbi:MAG: tRNA (adenosine(37)-N6)-threonylcarbamoyltransferase complex ATPase subunit type 1 TsaE [Tannerella sp.]|jgi:tRNA threonylcarbamoyladenosine biosynthesis protein TsaE|nr:tRNA (adenosine(37)-N6)-threonylcarbamoyltransferase complex ATPase subunit type 1 TsaE [Tannerella sp.]